jgi:hypothetical protein
MTKGLEVLANWTWSHAIDTGSNSTKNVAYGFNSTNGNGNNARMQWLAASDRGNSDNDRRHVINAALTYETPKLGSLGPVSAPIAMAVRTIVNGWSFSPNIKYQTGTPITVYVSRLAQGYDNSNPPKPVLYDLAIYTVRADYVPGQPVWVKDNTVTGGKYLNPKAFTTPESCTKANPMLCADGTSARNGVFGFGLFNADLSVRRFFPITERLKMEFRGDFFNVLNHKSWSNPSGNIGSVDINGVYVANGQANTSWNLINNAIGGGLASMYQQGGPRSIQLALKLTF